jgi:hypothetical protein
MARFPLVAFVGEKMGDAGVLLLMGMAVPFAALLIGLPVGLVVLGLLALAARF